MAWKEVEIRNWHDFLSHVEQIQGYLDSTLPIYDCRGQSNSEWTLKPSLLRYVEKYSFDFNQLIGIEKQLYAEFLSQYDVYSEVKINLNNNVDMMVYWTIMQHYSCPTRLLDWTKSPFVALFFAVESDFEKDGSVFLFNSTKLEDINTDSGHKYQSLSKDQIIYDQTLNLLYPVFSWYKSKRSIAQGGTYSMSTNVTLDHYDIIEDTFLSIGSNNYYYKLIIPKELKVEFLARLNTMNINARSLFPDLDGLGRSLKHIIDLRSLKDIII